MRNTESNGREKSLRWTFFITYVCCSYSRHFSLSRETCPSDRMFSCHRNLLIQICFQTGILFLQQYLPSCYKKPLVNSYFSKFHDQNFPHGTVNISSDRYALTMRENLLLCQETFYCNQKSLSIKGNILWHQDPIKIPPWWNSFILLFWNSKSVFNEFALTKKNVRLTLKVVS